MDRLIVRRAVDAARRIAGWMTSEELEWLAETASSKRAIVEIGSWKGRSTKALALATPGMVYAVDTWDIAGSAENHVYREVVTRGSDAIRADFERNLEAEIAAGKVRIVPERHENAPSILVELLGIGGADMVFIDGSHQFEAVKRDINGLLPLLKKGGMLSGHDYRAEDSGVARAVKELTSGFNRGRGSIWYYIVP